MAAPPRAKDTTRKVAFPLKGTWAGPRHIGAIVWCRNYLISRISLLPAHRTLITLITHRATLCRLLTRHWPASQTARQRRFSGDAALFSCTWPCAPSATRMHAATAGPRASAAGPRPLPLLLLVGPGPQPPPPSPGPAPPPPPPLRRRAAGSALPSSISISACRMFVAELASRLQENFSRRSITQPHASPVWHWRGGASSGNPGHG